MAGGHVDRIVLQSNYQEPGQTYDDKKTEGAFEVIAQQVDNNWDDLNNQVNSQVNSLSIHKTSGDHDSRYYTKSELGSYLQGGETLIKYDVFTIVNSNNGNGTFTYLDSGGANITGTLTAEGYQTFTLQNGTYQPGENRIEGRVNDTLFRDAASGGLREEAPDKITLTAPEGNGAEITFKYFENLGLMGKHAINHEAGGADEIKGLVEVSAVAPTANLYVNKLWLDISS